MTSHDSSSESSALSNILKQTMNIQSTLNHLLEQEHLAKTEYEAKPDDALLEHKYKQYQQHVKDLTVQRDFLRDQAALLSKESLTGGTSKQDSTKDAQPSNETPKLPAKSLTKSIPTYVSSDSECDSDHNYQTPHIRQRYSKPYVDKPIIKLKSPQPYKIGDDFEIFFDLFKSFTKDESFTRAIQVLKTLLSQDAYKICKHVFTEVSSIKELERELISVFSKSTNLTSAIHTFRQIKQLKDETKEAFATRVRICAAEAFPNFRQSDREPYMIQMFIQGLNVSQQQKNLLSVTEHKSLSEVVIIAARMADDVTEIHSVETYRGRQPSTICSYCKYPGHTIDECRKRLRNQNSSETCANCGFRHATSACRSPPKNEVTCHNCQKKGHYAKQCYSKNSNSLKCQLCQKPGHSAMQCRTVKVTAVKSNPEPTFIPSYQTAPNNATAPTPPPFSGNGQGLA